jgi:hypothetical protein
MPRLPPVTTATLFENSPDTIESSVTAVPPLKTSFDVIKEGRLIGDCRTPNIADFATAAAAP